MRIEITHPEVETLINQQVRSGAFRNPEEVILAALRSSVFFVPVVETSATSVTLDCSPRVAAIDNLRALGTTHKLSLEDLTIWQLRDEAQP